MYGICRTQRCCSVARTEGKVHIVKGKNRNVKVIEKPELILKFSQPAAKCQGCQ